MKLPCVIYLLFFSFALGTLGHAKTSLLSATVYDNDSPNKKALYRFQRTAQIKGNKTYVMRSFTDLNGKEVVKEKLLYIGEKLRRYNIEKLQTQEQGLIDIRSGKVHFSYKNRKGKREQDKEDLVENTVIGDQLGPHINKNWDKLLAGETIKIRYLVPSRTETVGFKLFKEKMGTCSNGKPSLIIKMKPSSFFISAIVDPLFFNVELDEKHRLCSYTGRTMPYQRKNDDWKDLDAHTVYVHTP